MNNNSSGRSSVFEVLGYTETNLFLKNNKMYIEVGHYDSADNQKHSICMHLPVISKECQTNIAESGNLSLPCTPNDLMDSIRGKVIHIKSILSDKAKTRRGFPVYFRIDEEQNYSDSLDDASVWGVPNLWAIGWDNKFIDLRKTKEEPIEGLLESLDE